MLNLIVVSAYFIGSDTKYRAVFTTVSIAISILLFLGVFVYHAVELVGKVYMQYNIEVSCGKTDQEKRGEER